MIAIIIQARLGSSRLPQKMGRLFYQSETLLGVLLERLNEAAIGLPIILATSANEQDKLLVTIADSKRIQWFQGDEANVLARFIEAAEVYNVKKIIRICADNPFIDIESLKALIEETDNSDYDYISFAYNDIPVIKTHFGFWGEAVKLSALKKVHQLTNVKPYLEHVTKYIYEHPELFSIKWLSLPSEIAQRKDIRLTVDTAEDFRIAQEIFEAVYTRNEHFSIRDVLKYLDTHPAYLAQMKEQITLNEK